MQQDSTTMESPINTNNPKARNTSALKAIAIATSIIAICGIGFGIFGIIKNSEANVKISNLESEIASLRKQLEQKTPTEPETDNATPNPSPDQNDTDHTVITQKYLEPESWNVRFAYPDGVTDVQYHIQDVNWDGTLYIDAITKDGKTYDVNLFGGKDSYRHYPFFLGAVARLSITSSPSGWVIDAPLLFEDNNYNYYRSGGNGYETGDAAEYEEACRIVDTLLNNVEPI